MLDRTTGQPLTKEELVKTADRETLELALIWLHTESIKTKMGLLQLSALLQCENTIDAIVEKVKQLLDVSRM